MKKLIGILFALFLLSFCEKEKRYCYDCNRHVYNVTTQTWNETYLEYCDKTTNEINDIMRQHLVPHLEWMECTKRK